jgi:hypothetical protein
MRMADHGHAGLVEADCVQERLDGGAAFGGSSGDGVEEYFDLPVTGLLIVDQ